MYTDVRGEDLCYVLGSWSYAYARTGDALADEPISTVESCRASVQRIAHHVALFNRPS